MLQLQCDEDDEDDDGNDGLLSHKSHLGLQLVAQSRSCPEADDPMQSKLHRIIIDHRSPYQRKSSPFGQEGGGSGGERKVEGGLLWRDSRGSKGGGRQRREGGSGGGGNNSCGHSVFLFVEEGGWLVCGGREEEEGGGGCFVEPSCLRFHSGRHLLMRKHSDTLMGRR